MPVQATSSSDTLEVMSNASQPSSKLDEGAERTSGAVLTSPHMATTPSPYKGAGTRDEPYIVDWLAGELENPRNWSKKRKWCVGGVAPRCATATLTINSLQAHHHLHKSLSPRVE